jgi:hypothetical protein
MKTIGGKFSDSEVEEIETFCATLGITKNDLVRSAIPFYIRAMKLTPFENNWVYKGAWQRDSEGRSKRAPYDETLRSEEIERSSYSQGCNG